MERCLPVQALGHSQRQNMLTPEKSSKSSLETARVIQPNLVYVINLPQSLANEALLRTPEFFGQYGRITKCVVNKVPVTQSGTVAYSVYVTFAQETEAALCIKACNNFEVQGHTLRATYGTTKYCSFFISGQTCPKVHCCFLHSLAPHRNTLDRYGLPINKHIQPEGAVLDQLNIRVLPQSNRPGFPKACVAPKKQLSCSSPDRSRPL